MSTPVCPFNLPACAPIVAPAGTQGPPGVQGAPPPLAIGNISTLSPGANAQVALRDNPAGGYFIDFGLPQGPAGTLTLAQAESLFAQIAPADGSYRIVTNENGTFLELWNPTQNKWNAVVVNGAAGQEQIAIEPSET